MSSLNDYAESREEQEEAWDFSLHLEIPTAGLFALSPPSAEDDDSVLDFAADAAEHYPPGKDYDVPVDASLVDDPLELAAARLDAEWELRQRDDGKTSSIDSNRTEATAREPATERLELTEGREVVPCDSGSDDATDAEATTRSTLPSLPKRGSISLAYFSVSDDDDGHNLSCLLEDDFELPPEGTPTLSLAAKKLPNSGQQDAPSARSTTSVTTDRKAPISGNDKGLTSSATEEDDAGFFDDLVLPSYLLGSAAPTSQAGEGTPSTPPTSEGEPESDHPSRNKHQFKTGSGSPRSTSRSLLPVKVDLQSILREKLEQRGGRGLLFGATTGLASSQCGPPTTPQEREKLERYREQPGELEGAELLGLDLSPPPATGTAGSGSSGDVKTAAPQNAHTAHQTTERSQIWTAKEMRDRLRTASSTRSREAQLASAARARQRVSADTRRTGLPVRRTASETSTPAVGGSARTSVAPPSIADPQPSNIQRPGVQGAAGTPRPPKFPPFAASSCDPTASPLRPLPASTSAQGPQRRPAGLRPSFSVSNLRQARQAESSVTGHNSIRASPAQGAAPVQPALRARHSQQHLSSSILPSAARAKEGVSTLDRRRSLQNLSHLASPTPKAVYVPPTAKSQPPPPRYGPHPSPSPMRAGIPSYAAPTAASANRIRERQMSSSSFVPPPRSRAHCGPSSARPPPLPAQGSVADRHLQVMSSQPCSRSSSPTKPCLGSTPRLHSSLATSSFRSRAIPTRYPISRPFLAPSPIKLYGDGTELDAVEDLPVSKELEKLRVVRPISRKSSAASLATAPSGSLGRKEGVKIASNLRQSDTAPPSKADHIDDYGKMNAKTGEPERKKLKRRREPHLIRHLGGKTTVKAQGEMTYNPVLQRWEGNESILRDFDEVLATSARPALISPLSSGLSSPLRSGQDLARFTDSAEAGQVQASGTIPPDASASRASANVVGGMVFNPATCSWHALAGPDAEEELELDWGGGTSGGENADDEAFGGDIASELDGWELGERQRLLQIRASLVLDVGSESDEDAGGQGLDPEQRKKSTKRRIWRESKEAEERCRLEMREWITDSNVDGERDAQRRWLWDLRSLILES